MPQGVRQRRSWDHWLPPAYSRPANTYLRLKPGANPEDIALKLPELVERYAEIAEDESETVRYYLHPISRMHLYSKIDMPGFTGDAGRPYKDIQQIYLLGLVGFFILTIACINFMNLSTARSASRAKEVGLRKVVGAYRSHLIKQFLGESLLLSALSACIALGLVYLALPPFSAFVQENLTLNSGLTLWILGITLFVGLLSGSYPALYLSAFEPATVLKGGAIKAGSAQAHVRKGLVVLQFAISIILIIGTIIVADQMRLIREKDLGFNKDEVVVASIFRQDRYQSNGGQLQKRYLQIKDAFSQHPNITTVSATSDLPGNSWPNREWFFPEGDLNRGVEVRVFGADEAFIGCYDIPLLSGRNYDRTYAERAWERRGKPGELFVINETAAKVFGWTRPGRKSVELTRSKRTCNRRGQRLSLSAPLRNHRTTGHHSRVVSPQPPLHADSTARTLGDNGISTTHLDGISPHPRARNRLCVRPIGTLVSGRPAHGANIHARHLSSRSLWRVWDYWDWQPSPQNSAQKK